MSRSSCDSSLNGTYEKDYINEKPVKATSKQKTSERTVSAGDKNSTSNFSQHNAIHQTCSSADFSLENTTKERWNDIDLVESGHEFQHTSDSKLLTMNQCVFQKLIQKQISQRMLCSPFLVEQ